MTEEIEKANVLRGQVATLTESLASANKKISDKENEMKLLKESFDKSTEEWAFEKKSYEHKLVRLQERVDLMVGNIKKYRSEAYKAPESIKEVFKSGSEVQKLSESVQKVDRGEVRLGHLLSRVTKK